MVRSPGTELECFFIQKWCVLAESTHQEFEGRWNMFILPKKFAPENVRAWFSMFSPVMQVTLDVILFNILYGIGVTLIWTNPIARQRLGYRFGNILHWLEFLHRRLVKTLLNNTFLGLKNLTAIGMPRSKVVFILVQLFVANLRDEVVGNSIDAFPLRMASLGKWIDVDSNLSVLAICSSKNWHGELVMLVMVTKLGWSSRPLLRCYTEVV